MATSSPEYDVDCCSTSENVTFLVNDRMSINVSTYISSICFAIAGALGFVGNSVTLLAFIVERKLLRKNFNLLVLNLTLADMCVAVLDIPFQVALNLLGYWPFGVVECALLILVDWGMTFVSIFTLVAISLDRYWAACYAQSYKIHNTRKRTLICIAFIWLVGLLINYLLITNYIEQSSVKECVYPTPQSIRPIFWISTLRPCWSFVLPFTDALNTTAIEVITCNYNAPVKDKRIAMCYLQPLAKTHLGQNY